MDNNELIKKSNAEKLDYFYKNNLKVHITKVNREWINCYIVKKISDDVYLIHDERSDKDVRLFLSEVWDCEQWKPKPKNEDGGKDVSQP